MRKNIFISVSAATPLTEGPSTHILFCKVLYAQNKPEISGFVTVPSTLRLTLKGTILIIRVHNLRVTSLQLYLKNDSTIGISREFTEQRQSAMLLTLHHRRFRTGTLDTTAEWLYLKESDVDENVLIKFWWTPVDTGRKLNVHKTFRRRPGRLYVQFTSCIYGVVITCLF